MSIPSRLLPLLKQFDEGHKRLITRLQGLTDTEYLWEPVPNCWSIRPRSQSSTNFPRGGDWVLDLDQPEPAPSPFTTIAWRMCHLANGFAQRADYTIGTHSLSWNDFTVLPNAQPAIAFLDQSARAWRSALTSATDSDLDQIGHSAFPWGLDTRLPFLDIVWWVNQELLHHGAEIALLRDLYYFQTF